MTPGGGLTVPGPQRRRVHARKRARGAEAAPGEHGRIIGDAERLGRVVGGHDRRTPISAKLPQKPAEVIGAPGIQAGEGLIEQQDRGTVQERAGEGGPLLAPTG